MPATAVHGRIGTYTNYNCRCEPCRAANTDYYRAKKGSGRTREQYLADIAAESDRKEAAAREARRQRRAEVGRPKAVRRVAVAPAPVVTPTRDPSLHVHHWLLGEPSGPISLARCRDCGEVKQFGNSADAADELKGRKTWSLTTASEERRKAGVG